MQRFEEPPIEGQYLGQAPVYAALVVWGLPWASNPVRLGSIPTRRTIPTSPNGHGNQPVKLNVERSNRSVAAILLGYGVMVAP